MLAGDWGSYDFAYILDMPRLVPHLLALEASREAARVEVLPPHWLDPPKPAGAGDTHARASARIATRESSSARAWVQTRFVPGSAPLSVADILAIHRLVAEESELESGPCGAFRTVPVRVGRPRVGGFHEGAPAAQLPQLMERYVTFIDAAPVCDLPPAVTALLAHFFLDTLHPFLDGNGRTSRLIAAAILSRRGYRLQGTHALVRHFYNHEFRYHTLLHRSWQACPFDVTDFVAFGLEGIIAELRSVEAFLRMKCTRTSDSEPIHASVAGEAAPRLPRPKASPAHATHGTGVGRGLSVLAAALLSASSGVATAAGDFALTAAPEKAVVITGAETRFTVEFHSIGGFTGSVRPQSLGIEAARGAVGSWSVPTVKVSPGGVTRATFTVLTLLDTPPGEYPIVFQGVSDSLAHRAAPVTLTVSGPPKDAITAVFRPDAPVVGVTSCIISGQSSRGGWVTDLSTFPDGSVHSFSVKSNGAGAYMDGPFVLKQLGTYHDVLIDTETGGRTAIVYRGAGDFAATIDAPQRTLTSGQTAQILVTFSSLSGFAGIITPAIENLPAESNITATWSISRVAVGPGAPGSSRLTIKTAEATPAPATLRIHAKGINGSVARAAPDIVLKIVPPRAVVDNRPNLTTQIKQAGFRLPIAGSEGSR